MPIKISLDNNLCMEVNYYCTSLRLLKSVDNKFMIEFRDNTNPQPK